MDNILYNLYYNIKNPSSFKGIQTILSYARNINENIKRKDITEWLKKQRTYGLHYPFKYNYKTNPIVSKYINHIWFADLIEIKNLKSNDNFRYILTVIDNLSKKGYAEPLLNKKAETVKKAFLKIFNETKLKPLILVTDAGTEFTNQSLKKYIKWRKIKHLVFRDTTKASVVERWNKTIKDIIYKYLTKNKTNRFIDVLEQIVKNYNETVHSRTKFRPNDINLSNQDIVFNNLYKIKIPLESQKIFKGDFVRVLLSRDKFQKGYKPNFSHEVFKVHKVYKSSLFLKYRVKDKKGNVIRGSYYSSELFKIN